MQKHKKFSARIASLALAVAMVCTMLPISAFAAESVAAPDASSSSAANNTSEASSAPTASSSTSEASSVPAASSTSEASSAPAASSSSSEAFTAIPAATPRASGEVRIGETEYPTIWAAVAAAVDGDTITVLTEIYLNALFDGNPDGIVIKDKSITLELNGFTVHVDGHSEQVFCGFKMGDNGSLTIQDSSEAKTGKLETTMANINIIEQKTALPGTITLKSGTIATATSGNAHAILQTGSVGGSVIIEGGTVSARYGTKAAIELESSSLTMTGGAISAAKGAAVAANAAPVTISGGTVSSGDFAAITNQGAGKISIGGEAVINNTSATHATIEIQNPVLPSDGSVLVAIKDTATVENKIAPPYHAVSFPAPVTTANLKSYYSQADTATVGLINPAPPAVASIMDKEYATLFAAFKAAVAGDTVKMRANVALSGVNGASGITIADKNVTLDLAGNNITYTSDSPYAGSAIALNGTASLIVEDSSLTQSGVLSTAAGQSTISQASGASGYITVKSGTVAYAGSSDSGKTIELAGMNEYAFGTFEMTGGTVSATAGTAIKTPYGPVTITGGTVSANETAAIRSSDNAKIVIGGDATVTSACPKPVGSTKYDAPKGTIYMGEDTTKLHCLEIKDDAVVSNTAVSGGYAVYFQNPDIDFENLADYYTKAGTAIVGKVYPEEIDFVAQIDEKQYYTLRAALNAVAATGGTIKIIRDFNEVNVAVESDATVTIDLNGFDVVLTGANNNSYGFNFSYKNEDNASDCHLILTDNSTGGKVGTLTSTCYTGEGASPSGRTGMRVGSKLTVSKISLVADSGAANTLGTGAFGLMFALDPVLTIQDGATVTAKAAAISSGQSKAVSFSSKGTALGKIVIDNATLYAESFADAYSEFKCATDVQPEDASGTKLLPVEDPTNPDGWKRLKASYVSGPSIRVGAQSTAITYGTAGSATYTVTGASFESDAPFTPAVKWKSGEAWVDTAPTGITGAITGTGDDRSFAVTTTAAVNAGDYTFKIVSGAIESSAAKVTVGKAEYANKTMSVSVKSGTANPAATATLPVITGAAYGAVTVKTNAGGLVSGTPTISSNTLTMNIASKPADTTATLEIPVTSASNYKDFTLTVTVTAKDKETVSITGLTAATGLVYHGGTQPGYTGTVAVEGNKVPVSELVYTYTSTDGGGYSSATAPKNAGAYKLVVSVAESNEAYLGAHADILFSIGKKPLNVTADNKTMYYYHTLPAFTLRYEGFATGDNAANSLTDNTLAAGTATDGRTVGTFDITVNGHAQSKNYNPILIKGVLTVLAREMTSAVSAMPANPTKETVAVPAGSVPSGSNLSDLKLSVSYTVTTEDATALNSATAGKAAFANKANLEISLLDVVKNQTVQPKGEITVFLPYPSGTNKNDTIQLLHLLASGGTQEITPEKLDNGLKFKVNSLSPFAIGWVKPGSPSSSTPSSGTLPQYTITATAGPGGSMSTGTTVNVYEGESAGFTIIPNKGYQIADVVVNGKSIGAKNSYVFTNVRANQTIHATFKQAGHVNPKTGVASEEAFLK